MYGYDEYINGYAKKIFMVMMNIFTAIDHFTVVGLVTWPLNGFFVKWSEICTVIISMF